MSTIEKREVHAVTFLHSCECGKPIDCTGDDIYMGTPICSHFQCEPCTVAFYIEDNENKPMLVDVRTGKRFRQSEERIRESVRSQYRAPLESKLEPARRRYQDEKGELEYLDGSRPDPFTGAPYQTHEEERQHEEDERRRAQPGLLRR